MYDIYRKTIANINLENLSHNFDKLNELAGKTTLIPVVKADAYGHGADAIVKHLYYNHGVRFFAVSLLEEALELTQLNLDIEILIMGPLGKEDLNKVSECGFIFTLTSARMWQFVKSFEKPLRFHVKVDTGMHRLGLQNVEMILEVFNASKRASNLSLEGIYTHFATADSDESYFDKQEVAFNDVLKNLPYIPPVVHASNSSAIIKFEEELSNTNHARVGISLYGYSLESHVDYLKPVMTLLTHIAEIKTLKPGELLGYNITYKATEPERIAILPIGYADGWIRLNQGGDVVIHDTLYPIVGRVCMDMTFVKVDTSINEGDEVILFGEGRLSADKVAKRTQTISYEVLCQVSKRVPRVYNNRK